ncbi:MAG: hypothetical protein ABFD10_18785 [Prolixibacteraceae bacterium]
MTDGDQLRQAQRTEGARYGSASYPSPAEVVKLKLSAGAMLYVACITTSLDSVNSYFGDLPGAL